MTFRMDIVEEAERVTQAAIAEFLGAAGAEQAVVVKAVAGAGKTQLVTRATRAARAQGLRTIVCSPTNEQVFSIAWRLATSFPDELVTVYPASSVTLPQVLTALPNVVEARTPALANAGNLIVGTVAKLGDAFARDSLHSVDALLSDESYQSDSARYYAIANLAPTHLLVGDPGQLDPFTTIDDPDRWRGLAEDPLQTAVGVLLRNHPTTPVYRLPVTRRLDSRAVPVARAFYSDHPFDAAVTPGTRSLRMLPGVSGDSRTRLIDQTLNLAATDGWANLELPGAAVLTADPETVSLVVGLVQRLAERGPEVCCEIVPEWAPLDSRRIAVGVSHNDQKDLLRPGLDSAGFPQIVVETANKLQGREFDLVIAWHPLAGLPDPDGFHLDPGRLCVLLTRHRHACIVIGRASDRALVQGIPPSTPAYIGWDPDPILDGWDVHRAVFDRLNPFLIVA